MTAVPCSACGVGTTERVRLVPDLSSPTFASREFEVGQCESCQGLRLDEPGAAVRAALRLLGKDEGQDALAAKAFEESGVDVWRLMYYSRNNPEPNRKPWQHVSRSDKAELRRGYAAMLDQRVHAATAGQDREVPPAPPPAEFGRGCAFCGLGAAPGWSVIRTHHLTPGPEMRSLVLCPACASVTENHGAIGQVAIAKAFMAYRGLDHPADAVKVKPWIALGVEPGEPWEFIGEVREPDPAPSLAALAHQVAGLTAEVAALREAVGQ